MSTPTQEIKAERPANELLRRLREIERTGEPYADELPFILTRDSRYLSGNPNLFSSQRERAFIFRDDSQALQLIRQFPVLLRGARVGHFNPIRRTA